MTGIEQVFYWYKQKDGKSMLWQNVVVTAADQLRQRMAWALSQIYVLATDNDDFKRYQEIYHQYYDIFVRHAFGNLHSVLQEVSRSPLMGRYVRAPSFLPLALHALPDACLR